MDKLKVMITIRKTECALIPTGNGGKFETAWKKWNMSRVLNKKEDLYTWRKGAGGASEQNEDMRKGMEAWKWEVPGPEINSEWKELSLYGRESVGGRNLH